MKILVAEDERKVREFIIQALEESGLVVDHVSTLADLLTSLATTSYDLLILDRLLEKDDAMSSLGFIRGRQPGLKVLILSALGDVDERVRGLTEGADDYLGKPFHVSELIARVRSLARRRDQKRDTELVVGDLVIDLERQRVHRNGKRVPMTKKEFQLLTLLARHPGTVFSKTRILDQVWDLNHNPESNVVEVTIANLRSKLDHDHKPLLHSQRGVGYWLGEP